MRAAENVFPGASRSRNNEPRIDRAIAADLRDRAVRKQINDRHIDVVVAIRMKGNEGRLRDFTVHTADPGTYVAAG